MVMQLLHPLWLWGLLGLFVPLTIHLLHKRSQRVVLVGSLQPFKGGAPVQARSLKLNEIPLLLLRCLLLAVFVLLLAQPVLIEKRAPKKHLFIAPELAGMVNADSLRAAGFSLHGLQPGLPVLEKVAAPDSLPYSYWEVFREIEALSGTGDTVWVQFYPTLDRFWGERPGLSKVLVSLPLPERPVQQQLTRAVQLSSGKVLAQWWEPGPAWLLKSDTIANADTVGLKTVPRIAPTALVLIDTLQVLLQADQEEENYQAEANRWLLALQLMDSLQPWQPIQVTQANTKATIIPEDPDLWIWLSAEAPGADFANKAGVVRIYQQLGRGAQWFLPDARDPILYAVQHSLLAQDNNRGRLAAFIPQLEELLRTLSPENMHPPILLSETQWQVRKSSAKKAGTADSSRSLVELLWVILILIFLLERWLSLQK